MNQTVKLTQSIHAYSTSDFATTLKKEIEALDIDTLPLQAGLTHSSYVSEDDYKVIILKITADENSIFAKTGIFYSGIIAGCSCADDPTPLDKITEYCEIEFQLNRHTAETQITLLPSTND